MSVKMVYYRLLHVLAIIGTLTFVHCQSRIRWCTVSDAEQWKCRDMSGNFTLRRLSPQIKCVQARHRYECMTWIKKERADLVRIDDTDVWAAGQFYGLTPIVAEKYTRVRNAEAFKYKAVALVKANGPVQSLADLKGSNSCHTGVGRSAGWIVPVANLIAKGLMPVADCFNTVKNVAGFFGKSCSPGALDPVNNPQGDNPSKVCELCQSPSTCSQTDVFAGYLGAVRCLHEGQGHVAFVTHTTMNEALTYYSNQGLPLPNLANYRLLCPDGRIEPVNNWNNCSWATRPSDAIVTAASKPAQRKTLYRSILVRAAAFFGPASREFQMFSSSQYGGENLLFSDQTRLLDGLPSDMDYMRYFDDGFISSMRNYTNCRTDFRWCTSSRAGKAKCEEMRAAFSANRITKRMSCLQGDSSTSCMQMIQENKADVMVAGGSEIYRAGRYENMVPIMSESYQLIGNHPTSYWSVAVVRKTNKDITIDNLKGKTSCHTGIGKSAGWNVPIGFLLEEGHLQIEACDVPLSVSKYFSSSCVPGALDPKYNPSARNTENLCALCGGKNNCQRNKSNKYYSYAGALRCLVETNADVAFVAHSTVLDNADGKNRQAWAKNLKSRDFELLCPDGTRQPVTSWDQCYLARVPAQAIMTRSQTPPATRAYFSNIIATGQSTLGDDRNAEFTMFDSPQNKTDVIFKDNTVRLTRIPPPNQSYDTFLDEFYLETLTALDAEECTGSSATSALRVTYLTLCLCLTRLLGKIFF